MTSLLEHTESSYIVHSAYLRPDFSELFKFDYCIHHDTTVFDYALLSPGQTIVWAAKGRANDDDNGHYLSIRRERIYEISNIQMWFEHDFVVNFLTINICISYFYCIIILMIHIID